MRRCARAPCRSSTDSPLSLRERVGEREAGADFCPHSLCSTLWITWWQSSQAASSRRLQAVDQLLPSAWQIP
ncbi:hypothetical protein ppKF707_1853 [Metapseudomonas furukawaii]|uniref:Uncharacterized protein n=1 Tax=Metapseudomonas furukawaii TaxID=1149133 RepID=A0AAD1C4J4_METFU|nr:hypothetical protein ppKF707_1853 [Pseudomonas furukawaii]BAU76847.1 hypothetical protein KF707C_51590 [Pseudomonas furukawaii]